MITLSEIRQIIEDLQLSEHTYMGNVDNKKDKSIGIYGRRSISAFKKAVGGNDSYNIKEVSLLIHWNKSPGQSEAAAYDIFNAVQEIATEKILFVKLANNEPVPIGTDKFGIYEYLIDFDVYYRLEEM